MAGGTGLYPALLRSRVKDRKNAVGKRILEVLHKNEKLICCIFLIDRRTIFIKGIYVTV